MKSIHLHRLRVLFPALTWLFIQFTMTGGLLGATANAMQIEICSSFGLQQIMIDPDTGAPIEPVSHGEGCEWCHSFGQIVDMTDRGGVDWVAMARDHQHKLILSHAPLTPLRLVGDYQSRAPPHL